MLKYVDVEVTFAEIPDEIALCINISNCPCCCKNCHSSYLAEDIGSELNTQILEDLIKKNKGISCVSFMGGDSNPSYINTLASSVREIFPNLKVAWYSGRDHINNIINLDNFDYIKLGPYEENKGPLNNPNTNQKFYKIENRKMYDCTYLFWNNGNIVR